MCKESYSRKLGKRFVPADSMWKGRPGKTRHDKESGAYDKHYRNREATRLANKRKHRKA